MSPDVEAQRLALLKFPKKNKRLVFRKKYMLELPTWRVMIPDSTLKALNKPRIERPD